MTVTQTNKVFLFYSFIQTITIKPKLGPTYTNRLRQFAANLSKLFHEKNMATDCKLLGKEGFGFDGELVGVYLIVHVVFHKIYTLVHISAILYKRPFKKMCFAYGWEIFTRTLHQITCSFIAWRKNVRKLPGMFLDRRPLVHSCITLITNLWLYVPSEYDNQYWISAVIRRIARCEN